MPNMKELFANYNTMQLIVNLYMLCVSTSELNPRLKKLSEILGWSRKLFEFYEIHVEDDLLIKAIGENSLTNTVSKIKQSNIDANSFKGITVKNKRSFSDELNRKIKHVVKNKLLYDFGYHY